MIIPFSKFNTTLDLDNVSDDAITLTVTEALNSPFLAVIIVTPPLTGVTTPLLTVATSVLDDSQVVSSFSPPTATRLTSPSSNFVDIVLLVTLEGVVVLIAKAGLV